MLRQGLKIFILILSFVFISITRSLALEIYDLRVGAEQGYLVVSCQTGGDLPEERIDEALRHGVALRLQFKIILTRLRRLFRDKVILEQEVNRLVYYQAVKNVYLVQYEGAAIVPQRVPTIEEALKEAGKLENLPLIPLDKLKRQSTYRLKIKVIIQKEANPPLPFKIPLKMLHFIFGGGKMESGWESIRFRL